MSIIDGRPDIEWIPCSDCTLPICDYGDVKVDTDRHGRPVDIEHECDHLSSDYIVSTD